jgi:hypothetical protein
MDPENITPTLLESALHAWQQSREFPPQLLDMHWLEEARATAPIQRGIYLYDRLTAWTNEALRARRTVLGLPVEPPTSDVLEADFKLSDAELNAWSALYHRYLSPCTLSVEKLAKSAHVSPRHFRRLVEDGLQRLVELLRRAEMNAISAQKATFLRRYIPQPDYVRLFGVQELVERLQSWLMAPQEPAFISIEGMGGIGKTTLARETACCLADCGHFASICWISARQEWLNRQGVLKPCATPERTLEDVVARLAAQLGQDHLIGLPAADKLNALTPILRASPHLIVVDNLETIEDHAQLVSALQPLSGLTRFLITSRHSLTQIPYARILSVPPLTPSDSQALLTSELRRQGKGNEISFAEMAEIYQLAGGLPLALILIAAQITRLPLPNVLNNLRRAEHGNPEVLYTYLYRRSWQLLEDPARRLLLSTLDIAPEGETLDWLRSMSGLTLPEFDFALDQLVNTSLLEVAGPLSIPIYRVHRLTTTFLQTNILAEWD